MDNHDLFSFTLSAIRIYHKKSLSTIKRQNFLKKFFKNYTIHPKCGIFLLAEVLLYLQI